jgi:MFS family permease
MGMLGSGSLIGALMLANERDYQQLEHRVAIAGVAVGIGLCIFAVNELFGIALGLLIIIGLASTTVYATSNALIQLTVPDHLRGRIMALFAVSLHGMVSIGQLAAGSIADLISAPATAGLSGIALFILAFYLAMKLFRIKNKISGI